MWDPRQACWNVHGSIGGCKCPSGAYISRVHERCLLCSSLQKSISGDTDSRKEIQRLGRQGSIYRPHHPAKRVPSGRERRNERGVSKGLVLLIGQTADVGVGACTCVLAWPSVWTTNETTHLWLRDFGGQFRIGGCHGSWRSYQGTGELWCPRSLPGVGHQGDMWLLTSIWQKVPGWHTTWFCGTVPIWRSGWPWCELLPVVEAGHYSIYYL